MSVCIRISDKCSSQANKSFVWMFIEKLPFVMRFNTILMFVLWFTQCFVYYDTGAADHIKCILRLCGLNISLECWNISTLLFLNEYIELVQYYPLVDALRTCALSTYTLQLNEIGKYNTLCSFNRWCPLFIVYYLFLLAL